jgi:prolyl-tRNA synthetase
MACIAEQHHDERGLLWPATVAPYPVHMVVLQGKEVDTGRIAASIEAALTEAGLEPLVDDRVESAGVKFNDADLIGLPIRLTVSERAFKQGGVEMKLRASGNSTIVPLEQVVAVVRSAVDELSRIE